ncbi:MAG: diaminopimelate epimerase [Planctomycetia bacterium]|nr:diaminopimelate epimerase [Planctomycetia bacterium]
MRFTKMQGAGNDYIYVNCFDESLPVDPKEICPKICDRHFGVGSDGLVLILPSKVAEARMRMFNPDGSESEMCGNAIRCVAKYIYDHRIVSKNVFRIETGAGVLTLFCELENDLVSKVRVDMGEPILVPEMIPTTLRMPNSSVSPIIDLPLTVADRTFPVCCVSMGNPHCVTFVDQINDDWVLRIGPQIEKDIHFPRKVNAEFVEVLSRKELKMRVWERGTGETLACGTGACAVAISAMISNRTDRKITIHLVGGDLEIEWSDNNHILMTGPAVEVFSGQYPC